jgi:hypothetical protein
MSGDRKETKIKEIMTENRKKGKNARKNSRIYVYIYIYICPNLASTFVF